MKLPNSENVIIPREKLSEYLLSESHLVGRWKAKFFRSVGFGHEQVDALRDALMLLAKTGEVVVVIPTEYGIKYVVEGWIESPDKQRALVRTVWVVEEGENRPRLVTVYPA
jgi:hypothetical protein